MRAAKRRAQETGRSLTQFLADCLRAELQVPVRARAVRELLPTYAGKGLQPGVDLTDSSELDDLMSGR